MVQFTLTKYAENGQAAKIENADAFECAAEDFGGQMEPAVVDGKLVVTITAGTDEREGNYRLTITEQETGKVATADFTVCALDSVDRFTLREYNNGAVSEEDVSGTIYIKGGTSVSSTDWSNAKSSYSNETLYLLYDENGEPLRDLYTGLITSDASSPVTVEGISVNGQAALRISAIPVGSVENGTVEIGLSNSNAKVTVSYAVLTSRPESYLVYQIPADLTASAAELEAFLANGDDSVSKVSQYDWDGRSFVKNEAQSAGLTLTENSACRLMVAAQYTGGIFVVNAPSITKWYDETDAETSFATERGNWQTAILRLLTSMRVEAWPCT